MSAPARKATYADIEALPEHVTGELIDRILYTQARPASAHLAVGSELGVELGSAFGRGRGGPGGWVIRDEPELHLGDDVLVPDLAAWRVERFPPASPRAAYFDVAPDWVCEIVSPSTSLRDRSIKMPVYARHGVNHLWLVEPLECRIEAYERGDARWIVHGVFGDDREAHVPPFDAVAIDLVRIWDETGRDPVP